jgi:hypothetical protein
VSIRFLASLQRKRRRHPENRLLEPPAIHGGG